jgi:soluble lytic murein transglycosylase-like protein
MIPEIIMATATLLGAKYDIDPKLILSVVKVESNFNVKAKGRSHGEIGLMQLHPRYFKAKYDVVNNMEVGVRHLAKLKKQCEPKYGKAWFICYNVGANTNYKYPTKYAYYKKVMVAYGEIARETHSRGSALSGGRLVCNTEVY